MPTPEVTLRSIEDADLAFVRKLYGTTRAHELEHTPWDQAARERFVDQQFQAQRSYYQAHYADAEQYVIEQAGQPIGRAYLLWTDTHLQIIDLALLPEACGRGIGGELLGRFLERVDREGLSAGLHVESYNPAQRLYFRHGFEVVGENGVYLKLRRNPSGQQAAATPSLRPAMPF
nr:GNAT family N-acetyltransferase [Pseudomonas sp. P818]